MSFNIIIKELLLVLSSNKTCIMYYRTSKLVRFQIVSVLLFESFRENNENKWRERRGTKYQGRGNEYNVEKTENRRS